MNKRNIVKVGIFFVVTILILEGHRLLDAAASKLEGNVHGLGHTFDGISLADFASALILINQFVFVLVAAYITYKRPKGLLIAVPAGAASILLSLRVIAGGGG